MSEPLDAEHRWPGAFDTLDAANRRAVIQSIANGWLEGWKPTRADVDNLVLAARGDITTEEYLRNAREKSLALEADLRLRMAQ